MYKIEDEVCKIVEVNCKEKKQNDVMKFVDLK